MGYEIKQTATGGIQLWEDQSGSQAAIPQCLNFAVVRAATNTVIVGTLPANARITRIDVIVPIISNAATTGTVSIGLSGGTATFFSTAQDVKASIGTFNQAATANWVVSGASQIMTCTYTETGTASTAGTFYVAIYFATN